MRSARRLLQSHFRAHAVAGQLGADAISNPAARAPSK